MEQIHRIFLIAQATKSVQTKLWIGSYNRYLYRLEICLLATMVEYPTIKMSCPWMMLLNYRQGMKRAYLQDCAIIIS